MNVTQYHNHDSRDGVFVDPAFTPGAAANLTRDTNFDGTIAGAVYAQPLYIENGPGGKAMLIVVTESNNVYALDAANGTVLWQRNVGPPVPLARLLCGNIDPLGITGTPVVDLASRTLLFDAMTTPDNGTTKRHLIYALNVDTGTTNAGWPVDVNATARSGGTVFSSTVQGQRGALALVGGAVCVPYGGLLGDCGTYYGWLVAVPLNNPASVGGWATTVRGGGAWAVGGIASDGSSPYLATGNTFGAVAWSGGEAIIRFPAGTLFTNVADFWAPTNWAALDSGDTDLGGSGAVLVDVPGASPSSLVVALGKDGNAYLLNRTNLGGISSPLAQAQVSYSGIIQAAASYRTSQGTYVVLHGGGAGCPGASGDLVALLITPTSPPTLSIAWCATASGRGSPFVTTTDGTNNTIVWSVGASGDQKLHGFEADTGAPVFAGGGPAELMTGTSPLITGIAARGRIFVAANNKVYAFATPTPHAALELAGDLVFGSVPANQTATRLLVLSNSVTGLITVSGISYPPGFTGPWSGTIPAHTSQQVTVLFAPTDQASYGGTLVVTNDGALAPGLMPISGTGYWPLTNFWTLWWQHTNGTVAAWSMQGTNATLLTQLNPAQPGLGWRVAGAASINGGSQTELLFENPSGAVAAWLMTGTTRQTASYLVPSRVDPAWRIAGTGDFNGDGQPDVLWQHTNGWISVWLMSGLTATQAVRFNPQWVDPTWRMAGSGDFNGDSQTDLLWQSADGKLAVWFMNGSNRTRASYLNPQQVDKSWRLAGTVDFNGDGHPGLVWQQASGTLAYWEMAGTNCVHSGHLNPAAVDPAWRIIGPR